MPKVSFSSSSRLFHLVFYPDSSSYSATSVLDSCSKLVFCSQYAYILHDSDKNDDDTLKKAHYHLVLSCKYPVTYSRVLNSLGLPESSMTLPDANSKARTFRSMVRYLVHADNSKKFQYSLDQISSNFDFSKFFDDASIDKASSAFLDLLEFMSQKGQTRRSIALYAASSGLIGYYRQYYHILWDIVIHEDYSKPDNLYQTLCESIDKFNEE